VHRGSDENSSCTVSGGCRYEKRASAASAVPVGVVAEFWRELVGLVRLEAPLPGWRRAASTAPGGPALTFQPVPEPKTGKTRVHLDLRTDDLPAALARIRALGGDYTGEVHVYDEGTVAVVADPEGTEFCLLGPPGSVVG
jgi:predicted enzyme related to lactoylglutathione lyase